jgi:CPA1 family monovalent cation:H+ antiporter
MWEFFAFVSNSIVFILIGLIISDITHIEFIDFILPIVISIIIVSIARAISVYGPI